MSAMFDIPRQSAEPCRGGAPVGQLEELPTLELAAILYLRAWCEGDAHRARIAGELRTALGPRGDAAAGDLDALMRLVAAAGRRPLMRHGPLCTCFGGDECAFAHMIAAALTDPEDAMLFAAPLFRGPAAFEAVRLAERLAPALLAVASAAPRTRRPTHHPDDHGPKH